MIMKRAIRKAFRGTRSKKVTTAKEFLKEIEKRFAKNEKAETSRLFANLISMRYKGKGNIREYNIREYNMEMFHLASKVKAIRLKMSEDLLVHLVLYFFPHNSVNLK